MKYNQLGKSDLRISEIGFGCMSLPSDEAIAERLLHSAMDGGVNFFDTADIYDRGNNEIILGKALRQKRKDIIIASKAGNIHKDDGSTGFHWDPSKKHILESIEGSLKRLQTDYIDLYQLHGGTINDNIDETIEVFELLKQQGKIRYYGISSIRPNVIREYVSRSPIVSVMMQYSLLDRRPEEESLDLLRQNGIGVLSRGALAQGLLAGKPAKAYLAHKEEEVSKAAQAIHAVSRAQRTEAQSAIRYVLSNPAICSAVAGIRTIDQLGEALGAASAPALDDNELNFLKSSVTAHRYTDHR